MININIIEKARKDQGLSKYAMAGKLGLSRQAYYEFLKKKSTSLKTLSKIAKILSLKTGDLIK